MCLLFMYFSVSGTGDRAWLEGLSASLEKGQGADQDWLIGWSLG